MLRWCWRRRWCSSARDRSRADYWRKNWGTEDRGRGKDGVKYEDLQICNLRRFRYCKTDSPSSSRQFVSYTRFLHREWFLNLIRFSPLIGNLCQPYPEIQVDATARRAPSRICGLCCQDLSIQSKKSMIAGRMCWRVVERFGEFRRGGSLAFQS